MVTDRPALVTAAAVFAQPDEFAVRPSWRWLAAPVALFAANSWRTMRCARSALEMVERGEDVRAIGLARAMYGYDATQAVQFVRGLRGRPRPDRT